MRVCVWEREGGGEREMEREIKRTEFNSYKSDIITSSIQFCILYSIRERILAELIRDFREYRR